MAITTTDVVTNVVSGVEIPKNALEMRLIVLAFMRANIDKLWITDQPNLSYADSFGVTLRDEFRFGVGEHGDEGEGIP